MQVRLHASRKQGKRLRCEGRMLDLRPYAQGEFSR